jgi:hypothetical protein
MHRVLCALLVLAIALAVPTVAGAAPVTTGTLYVQQAANASLVRSGTAWKLVLDRPDAHVIAFADRPARTGTAVRVSSFVGGWPATFGGDPPNAALEVEGAPASRDIALLELSAPRLSRGGRRLTYRARPLTATSASLDGLAKRADRGISGHLGRVTLFIDDGASDSGVLTISVTAMPTDQIYYALPLTLSATPGASFIASTPYTYWETVAGGVEIVCDQAAPGPCTASLSVPVAADPTQPLTLTIGGTMTMSWSGGPPQAINGTEQSVTLPPGS